MRYGKASRRSVLKTLGGTTLAGTSIGIGSASSEDEQTAFEKSVKGHHSQLTGSSGITTQEIIDPRADVYVGSDTTLNPNYGDKYESDDSDSLQDAVLQASYDTGTDRIEARAWDNVGYGTFQAWSYIGREFLAHGSGTATITTRPFISADLGYKNASANIKLELIIWDYTDDERWDDTIVDTSAIKTWSKEYVQSHNVSLEDGHGYGVQVKLSVSTTVDFSIGSAHADVSDENGGSQHVDVGLIDVKF